MVTVVVALKVSVSVARIPALTEMAPRATKMIAARIVDDDDWALKKCFFGGMRKKIRRDYDVVLAGRRLDVVFGVCEENECG
jgi:hypothetical protein